MSDDDEIKGEAGALPDQIAGIPAIEFLSFARQLREAEYIAFFYGNGLIHSSQAETTLPLITKMTPTLNTDSQQFVTLPMVTYANTIGAVKVCKTKTKFPFSIDFTSKRLKSWPSTYQALIQNEFDAALIVGYDALGLLPGPSAKALQKLPIIALSAMPSLTSQRAAVQFPTAITGAEVSGIMHRMDGNVAMLQPFHQGPKGVYTEEKVLTELFNRISTFQTSWRNGKNLSW